MPDNQTNSSINALENATDCGQLGTCPVSMNLPLGFFIWEMIDTLLIILTNGVTICILWRNHMFETASNVFIGCLALADLVSVAGLPFRICTDYLAVGTGWHVSCFVTILINNISMLLNMVTLCVISVDRLIFIERALEYHTLMTAKKAFHTSYIACGSAIFLVLICLSIGYNSESTASSVGLCFLGPRVHFIPKILMNLVPNMVLFPVTIGIYTRIGVVAWKQQRSVEPSGQPSAPQLQQADFKITKVMLNVLVVYITCNIIYALILFGATSIPDSLREMAIRVGTYIWRMNRWVNPLIFAGASKRFRQHTAKIFPRCSSHVSASELF